MPLTSPCHWLQGYTTYFTSEHTHLLALWKDVIGFRQGFNQLKWATEKDLARVKLDIGRAGQEVSTACLRAISQAQLGTAEKVCSFCCPATSAP